MLDNVLISSGTVHTRSVLEKLQPVPGGLCLIDNIFSQQVMEELEDYCNKTTLWELVQTPDFQTIQNRLKISWETDSIIEVVHNILLNNTHQINRVFNKNLKFNGIDLWKDFPGYTIAEHTDNPVFNVSMQVYIRNLPQLYTVFKFLGNIINTNPEPNHGYISDNTVGIPHWISKPVPENFIRYSLHATWI